MLGHRARPLATRGALRQRGVLLPPPSLGGTPRRQCRHVLSGAVRGGGPDAVRGEPGEPRAGGDPLRALPAGGGRASGGGTGPRGGGLGGPQAGASAALSPGAGQGRGEASGCGWGAATAATAAGAKGCERPRSAEPPVVRGRCLPAAGGGGWGCRPQGTGRGQKSFSPSPVGHCRSVSPGVLRMVPAVSLSSALSPPGCAGVGATDRPRLSEEVKCFKDVLKIPKGKKKKSLLHFFFIYIMSNKSLH